MTNPYQPNSNTPQNTPGAFGIMAVVTLNAALFVVISVGAYVADLPFWMAVLIGWTGAAAPTLAILAVTNALLPPAATPTRQTTLAFWDNDTAVEFWLATVPQLVQTAANGSAQQVERRKHCRPA